MVIMAARMNRARALAALALGTALTLSGCTIVLGQPGGDPYPGMRGDSGGMMGDSGSGEFSRSDIMFAQMMIPHHQQAVDMSDLAIETTADPEVRDLAEQIRDAQAPEIETMNGWLAEAGAGTSMGHDMGMGGMLSDDQMAALQDATGPEFDRLYLEGMIRHHEGAIRMTQMILGSDNPEVRGLGEAIVDSQTAEIALMRRMLGQ